jgi:glycosyltransferase involved in cell wall biosynthesis
MMRITFILSSLWLSGGVSVVVEYSNRLTQRGHQVSLVCPKDAHSIEIDAAISPEVRVVETGVSIVETSGFLGKARLAVSMASAVPPGDVVISTHTPTTVATFLACSLGHKGLPLWFYMDYSGMFEGRPVEAWLLKNAMRWHKAALVLSGHSADEIKAFSKNDGIVVGLGISNLALFQSFRGRHRNDPSTNPSILYLGDFRPRKGLNDFLAAAERVYDQRLDVELWIALKEPGEVECRVPHRVITRPSIQELAQLYATCDLFVSSSWYEGFGLPPLEAMACGAPVVTTDSGGVREYVRPGENCLLVPPKDPAKLSEAMLTVLNSTDLAEKFRRNGPVTSDEYTWEKATDRFEQALFKITGLH